MYSTRAALKAFQSS